MNTILHISTITFISLSVICGILYICFASFSRKADLSERKTSMLSMMRVSLIASVSTAFSISLLSDNASIEQSVALTVDLCSIIATCMLAVILFACAMHIIRLLIPRFYRDNFAISKIVKIAGIGAGVSLAISWILR